MNDEKYDYRAALAADIREALAYKGITTRPAEGHREDLYDELLVTDSVTGNASGSYFCSTWRAESALCHNWDLLREACAETCSNLCDLDPESADIVIRCYLLREVLDEVLAGLPEAAECKED